LQTMGFSGVLVDAVPQPLAGGSAGSSGSSGSGAVSGVHEDQLDQARA